MNTNKFLSSVLILFFSFSLVSAQEDARIQRKADKITKWMINNLDLTPKQISAIKEINYENAQNEELKRVAGVSFSNLSKVLTKEQIDKYQKEEEFDLEEFEEN